MDDGGGGEAVEGTSQILGAVVRRELAPPLSAFEQPAQRVLASVARVLGDAALVQADLDLDDLAEHLAIELVELLDTDTHVLEEGAHQGGSRALLVLERALDHGLVVAEGLVGDGLDQRVLRAEVVEDGRARDAGELRDVVHRDVLEAAAAEQELGGLEDPLPLLAAVAFALRGLGRGDHCTAV